MGPGSRFGEETHRALTGSRTDVHATLGSGAAPFLGSCPVGTTDGGAHARAGTMG